MKFRDGTTILLALICVTGALGYISQRWLGHDNPVEEFAEEIIEQQTGFDYDLSPGSPDGEHHKHADEEHQR